MDAKLTKIYYSPKGYWKGMAAIKKLANAAKVSEDEAKQWLTKQALWQVYLPGPRYTCTSLGPSLMSCCPMPFTRLIFSSFLMTNFHEERRFTSMP